MDQSSAEVLKSLVICLTSWPKFNTSYPVALGFCREKAENNVILQYTKKSKKLDFFFQIFKYILFFVFDTPALAIGTVSFPDFARAFSWLHDRLQFLLLHNLRFGANIRLAGLEIERRLRYFPRSFKMCSNQAPVCNVRLLYKLFEKREVQTARVLIVFDRSTSAQYTVGKNTHKKWRDFSINWKTSRTNIKQI